MDISNDSKIGGTGLKLIDEEEMNQPEFGTKRLKKTIIISIVILFILALIIIALIIYRMENPTKITAYIDGKQIAGLGEILDVQLDENGKEEIYVPIRSFASYLNKANTSFNYKTYKGDYNPKTEEESKCYSIRDKYEVAIFSEKSKIIYKVNLQNGNNDEYEEDHIDKEVFLNNGELYTSVDGIQKGYNVYISYNPKKKVVNIYTMDNIIAVHQKKLSAKAIGDYGILEIDDKNYNNWKTVFEELLVVKASNRKYGIIKGDYSEFILEPQYDSIKYISDSATFLVESNRKIGLFSKDGKRKIDLVYDQITAMGQHSNLYMVKTNNHYGVVDENGNIIIHPENEKIGINVTPFSNSVKNGYILLNKLIPVMQDRKWAFYDIKGKQITNGFIYDNIGCASINARNNVYGLLDIPDCDVVIVGDEYKKYSFMDLTGNDKMLPFVFDEIYLKISSGEISYNMTYNGKEYDVLKYLKQVK